MRYVNNKSFQCNLLFLSYAFYISSKKNVKVKVTAMHHDTFVRPCTKAVTLKHIMFYRKPALNIRVLCINIIKFNAGQRYYSRIFKRNLFINQNVSWYFWMTLYTDHYISVLNFQQQQQKKHILNILVMHVHFILFNSRKPCQEWF